MQYSEPGYYTISVVGEIQADFIQIISNYYSGNLNWRKQDKNSYLEGWIKDQVALSGLLNYLTDSHYIIISVEKDEQAIRNTNNPVPK